jgi:hypothetical protein
MKTDIKTYAPITGVVDCVGRTGNLVHRYQYEELEYKHFDLLKKINDLICWCNECRKKGEAVTLGMIQERLRNALGVAAEFPITIGAEYFNQKETVYASLIYADATEDFYRLKEKGSLWTYESGLKDFKLNWEPVVLTYPPHPLMNCKECGELIGHGHGCEI